MPWRVGKGAISNDVDTCELAGKDVGSISFRAIAIIPMRRIGQISSQIEASQVRRQMIQFFFIKARK